MAKHVHAMYAAIALSHCGGIAHWASALVMAKGGGTKAQGKIVKVKGAKKVHKGKAKANVKPSIGRAKLEGKAKPKDKANVKGNADGQDQDRARP